MYFFLFLPFKVKKDEEFFVWLDEDDDDDDDDDEDSDDLPFGLELSKVKLKSKFV